MGDELRDVTREAAERVFNHRTPGIVVVVEKIGDVDVRSHAFKGTSMGAVLFLHGVLAGVRALAGLYEMGLPFPPLSIKAKGEKR